MLLGGLDVLVSRNFFGAQIHSFEALLPAPACLADQSSSDPACTSAGVASDDGAAEDYRAVFIRAPAIMEAGPSVEILAEYELTPKEREAQVGIIFFLPFWLLSN